MGSTWQQDLIALEALKSESCVQVRRRIFRQLVESVIYEGIVVPFSQPAGNVTRFVLQGQDAEGRGVTYWCLGQRRLTFGRIRLQEDAPLIRIGSDGEAEAFSLRLFIQEVLNVPWTDQNKLGSFTEELEHTLLKDTMAQYVRMLGDTNLHQMNGEELESAVMDGHRYHPSYKSRIGFDYGDHLVYGPEFAQDVKPLWLAVSKAESRIAVMPDLTFDGLLREELGHEEVESFGKMLRSEGWEPEAYAFVPVHPWQWRRIIAPAYAEELNKKRLMLLSPSKDEYRAQQSIRTLSNRTAPQKTYVKLSMNLLNTSSSRQLLPHYTVTAPVISAWLQTLVDGDPYLKEEAKLILLREIAALSYDPQGSTPSPLYAAIGCIWRESLHGYLRDGEETAPFYALCTLERDGTPFIEPWLQTYGIEAWLNRLLERCVLPVLHLAAVHGVATESHAQNMVMVHRDGLPERLALKDFHEDVLYNRSFLSRPDLCPDLTQVHERYAHKEERANFEVEDIAPLRYLTLGALFFVNLAELAMMLHDRYGFEEGQFWQMTAACIHRHIERDARWKERFDTLDLFAPTTRVEQLTHKRLALQTKGLSHEVPNPLSAFLPSSYCTNREEIRL
ncbi:IucA/IucC family protein [Paenibacillus qinlingensis]|uniref:Siderophore synthetase component n=1 Tax=Paenibacillus qinlingensis TaxID=1837343 RepID=A0ABU1P181_9BACL|nr:IucA/IucC family protein [Paenibacillus qinlingensis]MDR6553496.1 siderophore synthetase component [Paenibacillus qinlingensis]